MPKVLCDINIILDVFLKRDPFFEKSHKIFQDIASGNLDGYISGISIDTIFYILRKNDKTAEESKAIIQDLLLIFSIANIDQLVIEKALEIKTRDLEDAIQLASAEEENCAFLITRNQKDFPSNSSVEVMSPEEFYTNFNTK